MFLNNSKQNFFVISRDSMVAWFEQLYRGYDP